MPINATARLINKQQLSRDIFEFKFKMIDPPVMNYISGQYIAIEVEKNKMRQYSIASAPELSKEEFDIILDVRPQGIGTKYLMNLLPGDDIEFLGEIGLFLLPINLSNNLFFVATATGISPLKSMIESLILRGETLNRKTYLYWGTQISEDIVYDDIFHKYVEENNLCRYEIFLSKEDNVKYNSGHVTHFIEKTKIDILKNAQFFICGGSDMIKSVQDLLLKKGVDKKQVFYEKFY